MAVVIETDENDENIATKVITKSPSENFVPLSSLIKERKVKEVKETFRAILRALKSIRAKVQSFYYIHPR